MTNEPPPSGRPSPAPFPLGPLAIPAPTPSSPATLATLPAVPSEPRLQGAALPIDITPDGDGLPRRFGKYTLLRKLAAGGMAELFLALQKSVAGFEKLVVIKRILPQMNQDRAFIDMLLHEARIAATLSHPNIVQIFDVGQVDGTYFIAMEHIHGEDIRSIVRQMKTAGYREFPLEHAIGIVLGMCAGLAYAHEKKDLDGSELHIVHRDISPQNVVVTFSGDVKIVDFGIAKSDAAESETKSGRLKGKVPYMSPEQARGERLDARSDIFATGVILFELTTGKRLFKGQSEYETLKLICDRDYPLPSWVKPGYPAELERIVMKALAKDRGERFQTAREMQAALEEFVRHERIRVSTIALQHFMQELFVEKLAAQKEALLQGKALADVIEQRQPSDPVLDGPEASRSSQALAMTSTPGTPRSLDEVRRGSKRKTAAVGLTILGVGAIVGVGTASLLPGQRPRAATPSALSSTTAVVAPIPRGTIQVTSNPPGAAIWINGDLRPEVTPAKLADLPLGRELDVKITKEGFEPERRDITLANDRPTGNVDVALKKGSVSLDVVISPPGVPGAVVLVDGKRVSGTKVEGLTSGDQHRVVVGAVGYADETATFIGAAQEQKRVEITLHKETHGSHSASRNVAAPAPRVDAVTGTGKLNVAASGGWCNVAVDGVARGATPIAGLELPAGSHKVTCTTPDGKVITNTVQVPTNDTFRHRFTLSSQ